MEKANTCVYLGQQLADYSFGDNHPFGPRRHASFYRAFTQKNMQQQVCVKAPVLAERNIIELFHGAEYVEKVIRLSESGAGYLDNGDTPAFKGVYAAACYVVGSVIDALESIIAGDCINAFVPIAGLHHAQRQQAAGFCVFNDCAIAIEYLQAKYHYTVLYVDIDAHHGDGVFYAFEDDPRLIFVDIHESGDYLYPGTGDSSEKGIGDAEGNKLNIPVPPDTDDEAFSNYWKMAESFIKQFEFDFIFLQCGADSVAGDPITHLKYSANSHAKATRSLLKIAKNKCQGRFLAMGGGGYNHDNIGAAWTAVVAELINYDHH